MDNISNIRKYAAILAVIVSAALFLPAALFAQGNVVGYAWGGRAYYENVPINSLPTNEQLDKLTHVMAVDVYTDAYGNLVRNQDITLDQLKNWLVSLVSRAHQRDVQVSIVIGGGDFASATSNAAYAGTTRRQNFVDNIVNFVDTYDLDGVDIDWEFPYNTTTNYTEWYQYVAFLQQLKLALPDKRISVALFRYAPDWWFDAPFIDIPAQIWSTVDAIHLMTYDQNAGEDGWQGNHSDAAKAIEAIDAWATWGTSGGRNLDKEKLHVGCAFYGYNTDANDDIIWTHVLYSSNGASLTCGNPGDSPTSLATKVNHCYANGYGGVFAWELGYDVAATSTNPPSLLNAIWTANEAKGGYPDVTITTQPAATTTVIRGSISGSLNVVTNKPSIDVIYQWYSNTANSNTGGTTIAGTTNASFTIPTTLTVGTYYYFCEAKSGRSTVRSNVAKVVVAKPPPPPTIIGPSYVNYLQSAGYHTGSGQIVNWWFRRADSAPVLVCTASQLTLQSVRPRSSSDNKSKEGDPMKQPKPPDLPFDPYGDGNGGGGSGGGGTYPSTYYLYITYGANQQSPEKTIYSYGTAVLNPVCISRGGSNSNPFEDRLTSVNTYPNPTSNILNIEIDAQASALDQVTDAPQIKTDKTYDLRLYDNQGNILRNAKTKGGSVQFNVSALPNGIYYLHIYDGINPKPEIQQIVVEH